MSEILVRRSRLSAAASIKDVVDAVHQMPSGRPAQRAAYGALTEWRGTFDGKPAQDAVQPGKLDLENPG